MKLSNELKNGILISLGIGVFFLLMDGLGLSKYYLLRVLNAFIIIYGLNRSIKSNLENGKKGYLDNLLSSALTGVIGVALSIFGLALYIDFRGGQTYLNKLSETFLFGGNPTIGEYCFGLLIEGIASVLMIVFVNMLLWSRKNSFAIES